ncbi:mannosyltransferase, putative [Thermodesulfovibrio yellowstonii DSM 11347]|uniref:Mannosyltransferase, putative n=1 Tax=Thermodesulfovibrio yellowstonii (strain ATCC 51303 / DSM 11347 / YP87) TaxID=289376 RepID=B5YJC4_THEYD|nr:mannosyltransferase, putative [Thermodesulfovibrio yellowstonii DSM 11347]
MSGGYKKYIVNVFPRLFDNKQIKDLLIFFPPQALNFVSLNNFPAQTWPFIDYYNGFMWLKSQIKKFSPDVIFIPTARWFCAGKVPVVSMIQNMAPLVFPFQGSIKETAKNMIRYYQSKRAIQKSTRIIALSNYVKNFLVKKWGIKENKIGVVYHGVSLSNIKIIKPKALKHLDNQIFIFTAGSIYPYRGLEDIIFAFNNLTKNLNNIYLVIAGEVPQSMKSYKSKLDGLIKSLNIHSKVIWTGFLSDEEMSWCYKNCSLFVTTSRIEACPNIVLEAMANGCLCVSTDSPPMPEFFGDIAIYYRAKNIESLTEAILKILFLDDKKKQEISKRIMSIAYSFSWDICAKKTIEQLQKAIDEYKKK